MHDVGELRRVTVEWHDPMPTAAYGRGLSGLDYLAAIRDGNVPKPPIAALLDFDLVEVGPGRAAFRCTPGERHYNPLGIVHGGLAATLLDSAMGCAVHSTLPEGRGYTTLEIKVNLVRAITRTVGPLRAEARIVHAGRQASTAEGRLVDAEGKLYAHGTTTCLIFDLPSERKP